MLSCKVIFDEIIHLSQLANKPIMSKSCYTYLKRNKNKYIS